jgi:hypothetical protein
MATPYGSLPEEIPSRGCSLPRDFLDIDAALTSGRYTRRRLVALAANADRGFDPKMFAHAIGALAQITDEAFAQYAVPAERISDLRQRFSQWREEIMKR